MTAESQVGGCLVFKTLPNHFLEYLCYFTLPPAVCAGLVVPCPHQNLVVMHFTLAVLWWLEKGSIFSCAHLPSDLLFEKLFLLPIFSWDCLVFTGNFESLHILDMSFADVICRNFSLLVACFFILLKGLSPTKVLKFGQVQFVYTFYIECLGHRV